MKDKIRFKIYMITLLFCMTIVGCINNGESAAPQHEDVVFPQECSVGPSRSVSQSCCLDYGIDACGAGLVCAAFDGRTIPTCYPLGVRTGGQSCNADNNCVSDSCTEQGFCQSLPAENCTANVGCNNPQADNEMWVCSTLLQRCIQGGQNDGGNCNEPSVCLSGYCVHSKCTSGQEGEDCEENADCVSQHCEAFTCVIDACYENGDCTTAGGCVNGQCTQGQNQDPCDDSDDCADPYLCTAGKCNLRNTGDVCSADEQCYEGCYQGQCVSLPPGEACDSEADCSLNSECIDNRCQATCDWFLECWQFGPDFICASGTCRRAGQLGDQCTEKSDCATELTCSIDGVCVQRSTLNQGCVLQVDCILELTCSTDNICVARSGLDEACTLTDNCEFGLNCTDNNICKTRDGEDCTDATQCESGVCSPNRRNGCYSPENGWSIGSCESDSECSDYQHCLDRHEVTCGGL